MLMEPVHMNYGVFPENPNVKRKPCTFAVPLLCTNQILEGPKLKNVGKYNYFPCGCCSHSYLAAATGYVL